MKKQAVKKPESEMTGVELMQQLVNVDESDDNEVSIKSYLLSRVFWSFDLLFYDKGRLMFFEKKDKLFGDKVLISMYSEGDLKQHSERLGIDVDKHIKVDEYILLPRKSIRHFEVSQSTCPNPDCESCKENDTTATLTILTDSKPIFLNFSTQGEALEVMVILNCFLEGEIEQFTETPFQDEYNFGFESK